MLIFDQEILREWASHAFFNKGGVFDENCKAIGFENNGSIVAAAIYSDFKCDGNGIPFQCELSGISIDKSWSKRYVISQIFAYPFIQLGLKRVQVLSSVNALGVNSFLEKLGFKKEGTLREAYVLGGDAFIWGMLSTECKWIKNEITVASSCS